MPRNPKLLVLSRSSWYWPIIQHRCHQSPNQFLPLLLHRAAVPSQFWFSRRPAPSTERLMASALRSTGLLRLGFRHIPSLLFRGPLLPAPSPGLGVARAGLLRLRCSASEAGDGRGKKVSARLALAQQVMRDAEERAASAGSDPAPKITMGNALQPPPLIAPIWVVL
jgi:peptidyl-tRNA hydrolase ICT1